MKHIIKTVNYLEDSGLLIKGFTEIIEKKQTKRTKGWMLLHKLGGSLLGNMLAE